MPPSSHGERIIARRLKPASPAAAVSFADLIVRRNRAVFSRRLPEYFRLILPYFHGVSIAQVSMVFG